MPNDPSLQLRFNRAYLKKQVKMIQKLVRHHLKQYPVLARQQELLTSIPGIGETTAAIILAEIQDW